MRNIVNINPKLNGIVSNKQLNWLNLPNPNKK